MNLPRTGLPSQAAVLDYAPPTERGHDPTTAMFFKALAFDFDGTLASDDRIGPGVREALGRARQAGLRLILVTGRTFFELGRVCDCLDLFEAVVAENGAVLYYSGSAMIRIGAASARPTSGRTGSPRDFLSGRARHRRSRAGGRSANTVRRWRRRA